MPLITVSGTASLTEQGNPWVFRFFPSDRLAKEAHVRYVVEQLGKRQLALIYQTTAYGQSGAAYIAAAAKRHGATLVFSEGIDTDVKDLAPILGRAAASGADALLLHLHAGSTALAIRQVAALGITVPVVAGSALHQPATAALLDPKELKGICAESASLARLRRVAAAGGVPGRVSRGIRRRSRRLCPRAIRRDPDAARRAGPWRPDRRSRCGRHSPAASGTAIAMRYASDGPRRHGA